MTVQTENNSRLEEFCDVSFSSLGTQCHTAFRARSHASATELSNRIEKWVVAFNARYSRFEPDSMISRINSAAGTDWVEIGEELENIFNLCDGFHWKTKGVFDPTMLPLTGLWDYKSEHPTIPGDREIEKALSLMGWSRVQRDGRKAFLPEAGMGLDIGGIGKEYAVDCVMQMLLEAGVQDAMVDFGQDIRVHGSPPDGDIWRVGLENPTDPGSCWCGIGVSKRAVATSGDYHRHFVIDGKRYGHILDPRSGYPISNGCLSVTTIAPTCTEAGIMSTAAAILGPDDGFDFMERAYQVEGCMWTDTKRRQTRKFDKYALRTK